MKKLSKEDNNDLKKEKEIIKYFLFIFFIANILFSQTKLNNFGVTEIIPTFKGYKKFSIIDLDKDGQHDLFLYGNKSKNFVYHKGIIDSTFSYPARKFFFYPIDDFKFFNHNQNKTDYYLFVSRNKRLVGLVSFTKSYSLQLLHTLEYKSYPSEIKIVDLNLDGKNEALIFGDNFDGIELVTNNGYRLTSNTIVTDAVIKDIDTIDFNHDQKIDLVAIDLLHNSIKFYENLENMTFAQGREIFFDETISTFERTYFNNDEFIDLIVAKETGFEVLLGDSVLSFSNRVNITNLFPPNKFLIDDINQDSTKDIITFNILNNTVNVKSLDSNFSSINYFLNGISDIKVVSDSTDKSLVLLSSKGKIQTIDSKEKWGSSFSFSIGGKINKIDCSLGNNWKIGNLFTLDHLENSLKIINVNSSGKFESIVQANFVNTVSTFTRSIDNKILVGYLQKNRLIEVLFKEPGERMFTKRNYIYSTYPIDNLFINENKDIMVVSSVNDSLFFQQFEISENEYKPLDAVKIDSLTLCYNYNENGLFYWTKKGNMIELNKLFNNEKGVLSSYNYVGGNIDSAMIIVKQYESDIYPILTIIKSSEKEKILYYNGTKILEVSIGDILLGNDLKRSKISFLYIPEKGKYIILSNSNQGVIKFFKFDFENNTLKPYKSIEAEFVSDYLVQQFFENIYLIYTDSENNIINFKLLDL